MGFYEASYFFIASCACFSVTSEAPELFFSRLGPFGRAWEIAEEMGVSEPRISQRKKDILEQLRGIAEEKRIQLSDYLD